MPILAAEPDLHPCNLLDRLHLGCEPGSQWYALYCRPRQEKQLMRRLRRLDISFYAPLVPKRTRTSSGRIRTSYLPLFDGYAFIYGIEEDRYQALTTGCVSRWISVGNSAELTTDLRQIRQLIETGVALTPESKLVSGERVRVRSGPFRDIEGVVIRRQNKKRLLVSVKYLQQGASVLLEDCQLERM